MPDRSDLYFEDTWPNTTFEQTLFDRGLVFRTKEEAIAKAKRMLEVK